MAVLPENVIHVTKAELEPFANGKRVGSYLLGRTIGQGSFAKVKEAIHVSTGEKVAIKMINKRKAREDRYVSRNLKREAAVMQKLRHPNIVRLLEVMETDTFYYLVTELCTGGELLDLICERKYLDEETTRKYVAQLISAVHAMHTTGVVHRDLKIENFLLDEQDDLKIVDFGLSNFLPTAALEAWERNGMCPLLLTTHCGSPAYAAPELLAQKPYGAQVDIWSIGVNMFAMLTGNLPYNLERFNIIDMYQRMVERRMMPFPKHVSQDARDLVLQLLDPIPETRITLEKASTHPWLRSSSFLPRSGSTVGRVAGRISLEMNQDIALHMADNMGMSMKEVVNSVTQNRASHSFSIYFLLNERLKRFERRKRHNEFGLAVNEFAKVKVIRKATLPTEINPKSKFTYKGVKITKGAFSQPHIQETENGCTKSDGESESEISMPGDAIERWNQYATFPRDRRTSSSSAPKSSSNRLVNATLDKGSDDIDYHRMSSPDTTDNSASSLESTQMLRSKLVNMERVDVTMPRRQMRRESGSDEELFTRSRSKSLTGRDEYEYSHNISPGVGRSRASSIVNSFHYMDASARHAPAGAAKNSNSPFRSLIPHSKNVKVLETDFIIVETQESVVRGKIPENTQLDETAIAEVAGDERNEENIENVETDSKEVETKTPRKKRILKLNQAADNAGRTNGTQIFKNNFMEIIPPPTPFKDRDLKVNIEVVQPRKAPSILKETKVGARQERKTVASERKANNRKNQRRTPNRSHSIGEIKVNSSEGKKFKKIELEKVRKVALEPFQSPSVQVAPVLQTISPFSLERVKQESAFNLDMMMNKVEVTTEPEQDHNNNYTVDNEYVQNLGEKRFDMNPFKVSVVKVAKCQCIPVLRPEVVEPQELTIKKDVAVPLSRTINEKQSQPNISSVSAGHENRSSPALSDKSEPTDRNFSPRQRNRRQPDQHDTSDTTSKENEGKKWTLNKVAINRLETKNRRSRSLNEIDFLERIERQETLQKNDCQIRYRTNSGGKFVTQRITSYKDQQNLMDVKNHYRKMKDQFKKPN